MINYLTFNRTSASSPAVAEGERSKRARIAPGDYVRCASTSMNAENLLKRLATSSLHHGATQTKNLTPAPLAVPVVVEHCAPTPAVGKRERGRPSKIAAAARARLMGPGDELLPVSLVETTNYDQFIIPTGVPEPTEAEVVRMMERLAFRNELRWHPIRVTPYLEVYDGKLRLAAARRLGFALTYLVDETLSLGDIVADRGEPRGWEFDQYCLYYAEQGREQYQRLLDFAKAHDFPLGAAAGLLQGGGVAGTEAVLAEFKRGRFRITHEAHAEQVVAIRDEYRRKLPTLGIKPKKDITIQRVFLNALSKQLAQSDVGTAELAPILDSIRWQPTEADYTRHLTRLIRETHRETLTH